MASFGCWQTWSARQAKIILCKRVLGLGLGARVSPPAGVGSAGQQRELHFLVSTFQLLLIYRGNNLDPVRAEVSGYLKPITTLHSCFRFKNVSGIMSSSFENRLWFSNKAAVTSLPSISPECQDTLPQGEGVYKFNLVVHNRVEWRDQSVVTLSSDKPTACQ